MKRILWFLTACLCFALSLILLYAAAWGHELFNPRLTIYVVGYTLGASLLFGAVLFSLHKARQIKRSSPKDTHA